MPEEGQLSEMPKLTRESIYGRITYCERRSIYMAVPNKNARVALLLVFERQVDNNEQPFETHKSSLLKKNRTAEPCGKLCQQKSSQRVGEDGVNLVLELNIIQHVDPSQHSFVEPNIVVIIIYLCCLRALMLFLRGMPNNRSRKHETYAN